MDSENNDVVIAPEAMVQAEWVRPEVRRIEAGIAEGSSGFGPVDAVFAS